jgi:hypothetical protein
MFHVAISSKKLEYLNLRERNKQNKYKKQNKKKEKEKRKEKKEKTKRNKTNKKRWFLWVSLGFFGFFWVSLDFFGFLWISWDFFGFLWGFFLGDCFVCFGFWSFFRFLGVCWGVFLEGGVSFFFFSLSFSPKFRPKIQVMYFWRVTWAFREKIELQVIVFEPPSGTRNFVQLVDGWKVAKKGRGSDLIK